MKKKRMHAGTICIAIGIAFLIMALLLFALNDAEDEKAAEVSEQTITLIKEQMQKNSLEKASRKAGGKASQESKDKETGAGSGIRGNGAGSGSGASGSEADFMEENDLADHTISIDGKRYLGVLFMPELGLEVPISEEMSEETLKLVPCKYYGSIEEGIVIAGHNYKSGFGKLSKARHGDKVILIGSDGVEHDYEVAEIEILEPDEIDAMIHTDFPLSLYTCTFGGKQRVTVRCR